jgi:hypothetical protein
LLALLKDVITRFIMIKNLLNKYQIKKFEYIKYFFSLCSVY